MGIYEVIALHNALNYINYTNPGNPYGLCFCEDVLQNFKSLYIIL